MRTDELIEVSGGESLSALHGEIRKQEQAGYQLVSVYRDRTYDRMSHKPERVYFYAVMRREIYP